VSVYGDPDAPRVVITGTGRAGTTFLVQLLTLAGVDTGYPDPTSDFRPEIRAGMERHPRPGSTRDEIAALPYVVKDPQISIYLPRLVDAGVLRVERLIVPVRDLDEAAGSRLRAGLAWVPDRHRPEDHEPSGFPSVGRQREKLAEFLGELVAAATTRGIPLTLIPFAELVGHPGRLYNRLRLLLPLGARDAFTASHGRATALYEGRQ